MNPYFAKKILVASDHLFGLREIAEHLWTFDDELKDAVNTWYWVDPDLSNKVLLTDYWTEISNRWKQLQVPMPNESLESWNALFRRFGVLPVESWSDVPETARQVAPLIRQLVAGSKRRRELQEDHEVTKYIKQHGTKYPNMTAAVKAFCFDKGLNFKKQYQDLTNDLRKHRNRAKSP